MSALIAFAMFPAVTVIVAALFRAEQRLTDADEARSHPHVTQIVS